MRECEDASSDLANGELLEPESKWNSKLFHTPLQCIHNTSTNMRLVCTNAMNVDEWWWMLMNTGSMSLFPAAGKRSWGGRGMGGDAVEGMHGCAPSPQIRLHNHFFCTGTTHNANHCTNFKCLPISEDPKSPLARKMKINLNRNLNMRYVAKTTVTTRGNHSRWDVGSIASGHWWVRGSRADTAISGLACRPQHWFH